MFAANLKIFIASLLKHRLFSLVNVVGLSIGLAGFLLISLYVMDEVSHDTQHHHADRVYRISSILVGVEQGGRTAIPTVSPRAGALLQQNFPEVEAFTRMASEPVYLSLDENGDYEDGIRFIDANFFSFFRFTWLQGAPETALSRPDSIVLTQSLATRYFGSADPLGQHLSLQGAGPLTVTGVIGDLARTHLEGQAFVTMGSLERLIGQEEMQSWFSARFQVYVRLQEGAKFTQLQPLFHDFLERQMPPAASALYDPDSTVLRDIHLSAPQAVGLAGGNRRADVLALMFVCLALLATACINFINLSTARSAERAKEVGLRKVLGAAGGQIFRQHMGESGLMVTVALLLGLALAEWALPALNAFSGKRMSLMGTPILLLPVAGLGLVVALLAGAYPALHLSRFTPRTALAPERTSQGKRLRNLLVILQFAMAIVLIVVTTVIYLQVQYGKRITLGFDKERVLIIENELGESWSAMKNRLLNEIGAISVSGAMNRPFRPIATSINVRHEGGNPLGENLSFFMVDFDYFETLGARFAAGRSLSPVFGNDAAVQPTPGDPHVSASLVVNRAMLDKLGWSVDTAVGKRLELNWSDDFSLSVVGEVVGVIENMRVDSLRRDVVPLLYMVPTSVSGLGYALVKLPAGNLIATLAAVDALWREVYPQQPIKRYFLDTAFESVYEAEEKQLSLLFTFTLLAIVISCLGLFGLAVFAAEQRRKEVGIRKTLGGSVWGIVLLLTNDFSKLVLIANVIAWPVAWYGSNRWLETFAYRIDLTPLIFISSGAIALCVAWITVGGTAARAAAAKPVLALRYE